MVDLVFITGTVLAIVSVGGIALTLVGIAMNKIQI